MMYYDNVLHHIDAKILKFQYYQEAVLPTHLQHYPKVLIKSIETRTVPLAFCDTVSTAGQFILKSVLQFHKTA